MVVGTFADWPRGDRAVRHPLWHLIPHTAIIKRKKDQPGEGLAPRAAENFPSPPVVETAA